jgi:hypothetical protein
MLRETGHGEAALTPSDSGKCIVRGRDESAAWSWQPLFFIPPVWKRQSETLSLMLPLPASPSPCLPPPAAPVISLWCGPGRIAAQHPVCMTKAASLPCCCPFTAHHPPPSTHMFPTSHCHNFGWWMVDGLAGCTFCRYTLTLFLAIRSVLFVCIACILSVYYLSSHNAPPPPPPAGL